MNAADLLVSAIAGALIVVSGGLYALFLALGRLRGSKTLARISHAAYLILAVSVLVLADRLSLSAPWYVIVVVMLVGYWLAPKAIWHLTDATHASEAGR